MSSGFFIRPLTTAEETVAIIALSFLGCAAVSAVFRWLLKKPSQPDPWDPSVAEEMDKENATPLCYHCLAPHAPEAEFCHECGAPVGPYTNFLPFPYLFSVGQTLRIGTSGSFKRSPLTILGFILLGIAEYTVLAPVYWFMLFRNLSHHPLVGGPDAGGGSAAAAGQAQP